MFKLWAATFSEDARAINLLTVPSNTDNYALEGRKFNLQWAFLCWRCGTSLAEAAAAGETLDRVDALQRPMPARRRLECISDRNARQGER